MDTLNKEKQMSKFKVGDKVVRTVKSPFIEDGDICTITSLVDDHLCLEGHDTTQFLSKFFKLAEVEKPKFKAGDKVIRTAYHPDIERGGVFIVKKINLDGLTLLLEGVVESTTLCTKFFELVPDAQGLSYPSKLIEEFITKTNGIVSFEKDTIIIIQNEDFIEYKCATMERAEEVMKALLVLHEGE